MCEENPSPCIEGFGVGERNLGSAAGSELTKVSRWASRRDNDRACPLSGARRTRCWEESSSSE